MPAHNTRLEPLAESSQRRVVLDVSADIIKLCKPRSSEAMSRESRMVVAIVKCDKSCLGRYSNAELMFAVETEETDAFAYGLK